MKRVGYYQFKPLLGEPELNRRSVAAVLDAAVPYGSGRDGSGRDGSGRDGALPDGPKADLIVLPELAFSGYCISDRQEALALAESADDSPSIEMLAGLCAKNGYHVVAGFAELEESSRGRKVFNSAALVGGEGLVGVYRKIHLFGFESELFDAGDAAPLVYDIGGLRVGMMICFDWFFPETARILALGGADVIAHPSNLVMDWCQSAMVTRCLENNVYSVTANRYGSERRGGAELTFTGGSRICGPRGRVPADGPQDGDDLRIVAIDPELARDKRLASGNHLLDERRAELYGKICE